MAGFGRSNSLSINTSGSLFGNNTSQGQQSAGLFGANTNANANAPSSQPSQPQTGGLFGAAPASQPSQSSSLFGATTSQPSQPQSAGLFGGLNKPAATGTSLFGGSTAASQPQQGASLFGGALGGNAQTQNQTTSQSGGLFGQQAKPSLFGSSTQQSTTTPSLFGNTAQQQNKPAAPSLFGATQQNQPQQQNTMFGMASQNTGAQPVQGGIQIKTIDSIKGTTRFSELHPDFQNEIQKLDDIFQGHMSNSQRIREILPQQGETVASLAPDVSYIEQFLSTMELGIDNDSGNVAGLKELVQRDIEEAKLCGRAVTNQTLPAQFRYGNAANLTASTANPQATTSADDDDPTKPVDLVPYFSHRADNLSATLELYQRQVREIEAHLRTMEAGTVEKAQQLAGRSGIRDQKKELIEALRAMEGAILDAAKKVGKTRDLAMQHTLGSVGGAVL